MRDEAIVYVGGSLWPSKRVWRHATSKAKHFDAAFYLPVNPPALWHCERFWILTIRPMHNATFNDERGTAPAWG